MLEPETWSELADDVLRFPVPTLTLPPATRTNHFLVGTDRGWVLLDAAAADDSAATDLLDTLRQVVGRGAIRAIVLSHHHQDHCNRALWLAERLDVDEVWAHEHTWAHLTDEQVPAALRRVLPAPSDAVDGKVVRVDEPTTWGLRTLHTPGHASGHVVVQAAGSSHVLAADLVAGVGTILIDPDDGDVGEYVDSLRRVQTLGAPRLHPAHGHTIDDVDERLEFYIQHRLMRHHRVIDALDRSGRTLADIARRAYADSPTAMVVLTERSTLAHLRWMQRLGEARCSEDGWWMKGG
jgi:glyoxylase-like metal-dependent hydrolase (beta-lactamase superfamily II)